MANDPVKVSELNDATALGLGDLLYVASVNTSSDTGYYEGKLSGQELGDSLLGVLGFPLLITGTSADTVAGAINELAGVTLTDTLTIGATSMTLSDAAITTASTLDIYTDAWGVSPSNVAVSTGSIVLTFEAQASALGVKVVVR